MRDVLSSSWTAVVEVVLMFAAEAVKEEPGAAVCHGEPGLGVPPPPHHSPSCLPVMRNDNPDCPSVLPTQLPGPLFLTLSELKPESAPPVCWS